MVDFFIKIAGAEMNCKESNGIMEMADVIVINKADGDNIRKAKLAKVNSTGHYIFSGQKIRLDTHNRYLQRY
jgi:putative protein kinase ArgK-like GTPase of G3E family